MRNALKKLSSMRAKPTNPLARKIQGMSEEMRQNMMKNYEGEQERLLAMRREEMIGLEDENMLYAGERRRAELEQRVGIGKTASFLMKKGYPRIQANALALAFGAEMSGLKEELVSQVGNARANAILKEMREKLLTIFKEPKNMGTLIMEVRTKDKRFSQTVLMQVRNEVFEKNGLPTD